MLLRQLSLSLIRSLEACTVLPHSDSQHHNCSGAPYWWLLQSSLATVVGKTGTEYVTNHGITHTHDIHISMRAPY
eukprot:4043135-Pleurochrysis_carterae.AAC.6